MGLAPTAQPAADGKDHEPLSLSPPEQCTDDDRAHVGVELHHTTGLELRAATLP